MKALHDVTQDRQAEGIARGLAARVAAIFKEFVADVKAPSAINEIECEIGDDAEVVAEVELLRARVQAARSWGS